MSNVLYYPNLKKPNTGTLVGTSYCLDVLPRNTALDPLFVSSSSAVDVKEIRFHDATAAPINGSGGAWVPLGSGIALASDISELQISCTTAEPIAIGVGANAGVAVQKISLNRGDGPVSLKIK